LRTRSAWWIRRLTFALGFAALTGSSWDAGQSGPAAGSLLHTGYYEATRTRGHSYGATYRRSVYGLSLFVPTPDAVAPK